MSGYFLQTVVATVVTGDGSLNQPRMGEQLILQGLAGSVVGGIATLVSCLSNID